MIQLKNLLTPRRKVRYEPRRLRALSRDSLATEANEEIELLFSLSFYDNNMVEICFKIFSRKYFRNSFDVYIKETFAFVAF